MDQMADKIKQRFQDLNTRQHGGEDSDDNESSSPDDSD